MPPKRGRKNKKRYGKSSPRKDKPRQQPDEGLEAECEPELPDIQEPNVILQHPAGAFAQVCDEENLFDFANQDFLMLFHYSIQEMDKMDLQMAKTKVPSHLLFSENVMEAYESTRLFMQMKKVSPQYLSSIISIRDIMENMYSVGGVPNLTQFTVTEEQFLASAHSPTASAYEQEQRRLSSSSQCSSQLSPLNMSAEQMAHSSGEYPNYPEEELEKEEEADDEPREEGAHSVSFSELAEYKDYSSDEAYEEDNTIHVLEFVHHQSRDRIEFKFHIPEISKHSKDKIIYILEDQLLAFYAENINGKSYIFQISTLFSHVVKNFRFYDIDAHDIVCIIVKKRKLAFWKGVHHVPKDAREKWLTEMKTVLRDIPGEAKNEEILENIGWYAFIRVVVLTSINPTSLHNALRMENSSVDLFHPPASAYGNFNHSFKSLDEIVLCSLEILKSRPFTQTLIDIIGAVVLRKIRSKRGKKPIRKFARMKAHSPYSSDKPKPSIPDKSRPLFPKLREKSKSGSKEEELQRKTMEAVDKFNEAKELCAREMWQEAIDLYTEAINLNEDPQYYRHRANAYYKLKIFTAAYNDARIALRSLNVVENVDSLVICAKSEIFVGNPICAVSFLMTVTKVLSQMDEDDRRNITQVSHMSHALLRDVVLGMEYISRGKVNEAAICIEKALQISISGRGLTVILILLRLVCKDYDKAAHLCVTMIEEGAKNALVLYLLGKSTFFMGERYEAMTYLNNSLQIKRTKVAKELLKKIKKINSFIQEGDNAVQERNFRAADVCYTNAMKEEPKNMNLVQFIFEKIGNVSQY